MTALRTLVEPSPPFAGATPPVVGMPAAPAAAAPVTCVLDRIDAAQVTTLSSFFREATTGIVVNCARASVATPDGLARLALLARGARQRSVPVDFVAVSTRVRRGLVAAGLHHLVSLSE